MNNRGARHQPHGPGTARVPLAAAWAPWLIAFAGMAAYADSFSGTFTFDDRESIVENPTIRHLWRMGAALSPPPGGLTVSGRPLVNLSVAINYALGGTNVWGYHAVNLAIHLLAGLTLFGIVRRTLRSHEALAFAIALLWTVHPLQTESVTYIVQRAESLMGLFYLLTLYCFIRSTDSTSSGGLGSGTLRAFRGPTADRQRNAQSVLLPKHSIRWDWLSVACCLFGMASKEVMVSAPVVVLLYDRTFVAGSVREAWRRRRSLYLGLASTWILLGYLVIGEGGGRSGSVGFGSGVPWLAYGLTQFQAIVQYLKLVIWPHPLVFEYGTFWVKDVGRVAPYACVVLPLMAATVVGLWRWPAWGFLGFWFFAILAPTSLVPGTTQMIAEHRMYLALAPVLVAIVCGGNALLRLSLDGARRPAAGTWWVVLTVVAAGFVALTALRNEDYHSEAALWADVVTKRPENALAHNNLGAALERMPGRLNDAIAQYQAAVRIEPDFAEAHNDLGKALANSPGRANEAIAQFEEAVRLRPNFAEAHDNLGNAWVGMPGKLNDAIAQFEAALRLKPDFAEAHNNLGNAWSNLPDRMNEAIAQYQEALRLKPDYPEAHNNLGDAWMSVPGKLDDAAAEYQEALRLKPDYPEAHYNLGNIWLSRPERLNDAIAQYREALRLRPEIAEAHFNLALALLRLPNRRDEAKAQLQEVLRLRPDYERARQILTLLQISPQ